MLQSITNWLRGKRAPAEPAPAAPAAFSTDGAYPTRKLEILAKLEERAQPGKILSWGQFTEIANEVGCTQPYVVAIANGSGYRVVTPSGRLRRAPLITEAARATTPAK